MTDMSMLLLKAPERAMSASPDKGRLSIFDRVIRTVPRSRPDRYLTERRQRHYVYN